MHLYGNHPQKPPNKKPQTRHLSQVSNQKLRKLPGCTERCEKTTVYDTHMPHQEARITLTYTKQVACATSNASFSDHPAKRDKWHCEAHNTTNFIEKGPRRFQNALGPPGSIHDKPQHRHGEQVMRLRTAQFNTPTRTLS